MTTWGQRFVLLAVLLVPVATVSVVVVGPTALAMLGAGWLAVAHRLGTGTLHQIPRTVVALGILALSFVASTAAAQAPASAVRITLTIIVGLGFTLAVSTFIRGADLPRYAGACLVMAGAVGAWSLANAGQMTAGVGGGVVTGRLQGPFAQPNELGAFCALLLPLCLAGLAAADRRATQIIAVAATIAVAAAGALSLSRGAWLGTAVGVLLVWFALPGVRAWLRRAGALIVAALVVGMVFSGGSVAGLLTERLASIGAAGDNPYDYRPELWETGARVALDHPLLGVGPGQFKVASSNGDYLLYNYVAEHPHNIVLTVAAELGLYGLVAFALVVGLLISGFVTAVRSEARSAKPSAPYWCAVGSTAGLLAMGVHGIVDMPLRNPIVNAAIWVVLALAIASTSAATSSPALERRRSTA